VVSFVEVEVYEGVRAYKFTDEAIVETCSLTYRAELEALA
jgi:hypothetical protein